MISCDILKEVRIKRVEAREILDSRQQPTVSCRVELEGGVSGEASVPSGASVGKYEAVTLAATEAIQNVNSVIAPKLIGQPAAEQTRIDQLMIDLDATANKSRLGANAILSVSLAVCRAAAVSQNQPLYRYLGQFFSTTPKLPIPFFNLLNGGRHGPQWGVDIQEIMAVPTRTSSFQERLKIGQGVFASLKEIFREKGWLWEFGDEGGLIAPVENNEMAVDLMVEAIQKAGHEGKAAVALDVAASELYQDGLYCLAKEDRQLTREEMIVLYQDWLEKYPLSSLEDPFSEDDWQSFAELTRGLGSQIQIVGDDLYATNPARIQKGLEMKATNAVLIKPNQIGTLTETIKVMTMVRQSGVKAMVSHRSGETEDSFIADLAVASGCGQIKAGAPEPKERMAKYQRLLEIEKDLTSQ